VPAPASDAETACALIGTAIPQSTEDVKACLFGEVTEDPETHRPSKTIGLFDPTSQVPDLKHIDAVIFFSIYYESTPGDPNLVQVYRYCQPFFQPAHETEARKTAIERICRSYGQMTNVQVRPV